MNRDLLCLNCASVHTPTWRADNSTGWLERINFVGLTSELHDHGYPLNVPFPYLTGINCDLCNAPIAGQIVVSRTLWNENREPYPPFWEEEYGTIMTREAAYLALKLAGREWPKGNP